MGPQLLLLLLLAVTALTVVALFNRDQLADSAPDSAPPITLVGPDLPLDVDTALLAWFSETEFEAALTEIYQRVHRALLRRRLVGLEPWVTIDILARWTQAPPSPFAPPPGGTL